MTKIHQESTNQVHQQSINEAIVNNEEETNYTVEEPDDINDNNVVSVCTNTVSNELVCSEISNNNCVLPRVPGIDSIEINETNRLHVGDTTEYHGTLTVENIVYESGVNSLEINGKNTENSREQVQIKTDKTKKALWNLSKTRLLQIVIILVLAIIFLVTLVVVLIKTRPVEEKSHKPIEDDFTSANTSFKFVPRIQWIAQPPAGELKELANPVRFIMISETRTESCNNTGDCIFRVRFLQTYHLESTGLDDIADNFIVGGDGAVYVGRGWHTEGAHTYGWNHLSIGISLVGTFMKVKPKQIQIDVCKELIEYGVKMGHISKYYKLFGSRQFTNNNNPGNAFYEELKTWPHWAELP